MIFRNRRENATIFQHKLIMDCDTNDEKMNYLSIICNYMDIRRDFLGNIPLLPIKKVRQYWWQLPSTPPFPFIPTAQW